MRWTWMALVALAAAFAPAAVQAELGDWLQDLPAAKTFALRKSRPLLVMSGDSRTCYYCKEADEKVFADAAWKAYAAAKGIVQYYADGAYPESLAVRKALHAEYYNPNFPTISIFRLKDTADLTSNALDAATNVELVGKFVYREKATINGIAVPAPSPANFIAILESFYSATHPEWLEDMPLGDDADFADDVPGGATPMTLAEGSIANSSARTLGGDDVADWFRFEATAGTTYLFMSRNYAVPAGVDTTFAIYAGDPSEAPAATLAGMAALGEGLSYTAAVTGTHYALVSRPVDPSVNGLSYTLSGTVIEGLPAVGELTNPLWDTAEVGRWTMSYEAAAATGKPMLVLFSGLRWCPHCILADAVTFSDPAFAAYVAANDLVLVVMDNARRNAAPSYPTEPGLGPTLLRETGYLTAHGLSRADGEAKLEANLAFQQSLALPGSTRIGYPTLLYLRPTPGKAVASVVGRVSYITLETDLATVLRQLDDLRGMAADPAEETDNLASSTTAVLPTPAADGVPVQTAGSIGGIDTTDWRVFTPAANTAWSFHVATAAKSSKNGAAARLTVGVYDSSGTAALPGQRLAEASGAAAGGVTLDFRPPVYGVPYRLCVQLADQPALVDCTIAASATPLSYEAQFEAAAFEAAQQQPQAALRVRLDTVIANDQPVALRYWTEDGTALAGREYTGVADGALVWTAAETGTVPVKTLNIPLTAAGLAPWEGSRDFVVHLEAVQNAKVIGTAAATVRLYCIPTFVDGPALVRTLSTGADAELRLGIANGLGGNLGVLMVSGALPRGMAAKLQGSELVLSGRPTRTGTSTAEFEVRTTVGAATTVGGRVAVTLIVLPVAAINPAAVGSFVGTVFTAGLPEVRGSLTLTASTNGRVQAKVAMQDRTYALTANSWTALSEDGSTFVADLVDARRGVTLSLTVDGTGAGAGVFTLGGEAMDVVFDRVAWHRVTNPALEYAGYYTVSLPVSRDVKATGGSLGYVPFGGGYLAITIAANGRVTYSGKMADGTRVSGTTAVIESMGGLGTPSGHVTIFAPLYRRGGYLSGRLDITPLSRRVAEAACVSACAPAAYFEWSYPGLQPQRGRTADAFTVTVEPCGMAYPKYTTLEAHGIPAAELRTAEAPADAAYAYRLQGQTERAYPMLDAFPEHLPLQVTAGRLVAPSATRPVRQADRSYVYNTGEGSNDSSLRIQYSRSTGVFSGSFRLYYDYQTPTWQHRTVTVRFEGILTPIPGSCCTADPLPLGHGFFLVPDNNAEAGYSFKRSYPIWLGEVVPEEP